MVERRSCCSGSIYSSWRGGRVALALSIWRGEEVLLLWLYLSGVERRLFVLLWLYLSGVERRSCCSGSIYLAWRGGRVALALSIWRGEEVGSGSIYLAWRGGRVALALSIWRGEEVSVLLWLYLSGVERRLCCSGSTYLAWRGGRVALALPIWRGEEVALLWLYLSGSTYPYLMRGSYCKGQRVSYPVQIVKPPEANL